MKAFVRLSGTWTCHSSSITAWLALTDADADDNLGQEVFLAVKKKSPLNTGCCWEHKHRKKRTNSPPLSSCWRPRRVGLVSPKSHG